MEFIQQNLMLVTLAVATGAMLLWQIFGSKISGIKEVGVIEATQLINHKDALVLDVREDREFSGGHIPDAKHIPLGQLGHRVGELEKFKERPIVINCRSGARSANACGILRKSGFTEVYNLKGGIMAWEQANMPITRK